MCGFILRIILNSAVLFSVLYYCLGIFVDTLGGILLGALIVGIINAAIRPLLVYAALPISFRVLGSTTVCTNIMAQFMVLKTLPGYQIIGIFSPASAVCIITLCSFTFSRLVQDR